MTNGVIKPALPSGRQAILYRHLQVYKIWFCLCSSGFSHYKNEQDKMFSIGFICFHGFGFFIWLFCPVHWYWVMQYFTFCKDLLGQLSAIDCT